MSASDRYLPAFGVYEGHKGHVIVLASVLDYNRRVGGQHGESYEANSAAFLEVVGLYARIAQQNPRGSQTPKHEF